jgi:hypothetical protein
MKGKTLLLVPSTTHKPSFEGKALLLVPSPIHKSCYEREGVVVSAFLYT